MIQFVKCKYTINKLFSLSCMLSAELIAPQNGIFNAYSYYLYRLLQISKPAPGVWRNLYAPLPLSEAAQILHWCCFSHLEVDWLEFQDYDIFALADLFLHLRPQGPPSLAEFPRLTTGEGWGQSQAMKNWRILMSVLRGVTNLNTRLLSTLDVECLDGGCFPDRTHINCTHWRFIDGPSKC